jgi:hypothetical protein
VSAGTRRALIWFSQPGLAHGPSHVTRPGFDFVSVVCPDTHTPRTLT